MKGRLENELKKVKRIEDLLSEMPDIIRKFYYNIQVNTAPSTCIAYLEAIRRLLNRFPGCPIEEIDSDMIAVYFNDINYAEINGEIRKTSVSYKQGTWTALNKIFNYLYERGDIKRNPMKIIPRPRSKDEKRESVTKLGDLNKIVNQVEKGIEYKGNYCFAKERHEKWKERDKVILTFFALTGMRKTALSEINVDDLSFEDMMITTIDKRDKVQEYNMTPKMVNEINAWLVKRAEILGDIECDALFISDNNCRISAKTVSRIVQRYSRSSIGKEISPHKLRGAFCEETYEKNNHDIEATKVAMGHASISTTSIYLKNKLTARRDAIYAMSDMILGKDE